MKVVIFGAGPTGLMAALAVERNGHEPVIYTHATVPSVVNEDMFLQRPLPGLKLTPTGDVTINYSRTGDAAGYAKKVYGNPAAAVSWSDVEWGYHPAWWLRPIYTQLFHRYRGNMLKLDITPSVASIIQLNYPLTLSTLPAPALCWQPAMHHFEEKQTWLARQRMEGGPTAGEKGQRMIYCGNESRTWFRYTRLNGWHTWEYAIVPPLDEISPETPIIPGRKYIGNNCDCHPEIHRVGRLAQWQRGVLNHHAFEQTTSILASAGLGKGA